MKEELYKCRTCGSRFHADTQGQEMWSISRNFEPNPVCWHKDYLVFEDAAVVINLAKVPDDSYEDEWYVKDGEGLFDTELNCLFVCQKLEWEHLEKHKKHIKMLQERSSLFFRNKPSFKHKL